MQTNQQRESCKVLVLRLVRVWERVLMLTLWLMRELGLLTLQCCVCVCSCLLHAAAAVASGAAAAGVRGCCLLVGDDKLLVVDLSCDFAGVGAVDGAANGEASAKDLLHAACQCAGKAAWAHGACNVDDGVQGQVAVVHS